MLTCDAMRGAWYALAHLGEWGHGLFIYVGEGPRPVVVFILFFPHLRLELVEESFFFSTGVV